MKLPTTLMAAVLALSLVPVASATKDLYEENLAWLESVALGAPQDDLRAAAGFAAGQGVSLAALQVPSAARVSATALHYGEGWHVCTWAAGSAAAPCDLAAGVSTPVPCFDVPAHWALYVWSPQQLQVVNGIGGDLRLDIYWSETHTPPLSGDYNDYLVVNGPPVTSTGSGCIVANSPSFVLTAVDGIHQYA